MTGVNIQRNCSCWYARSGLEGHSDLSKDKGLKSATNRSSDPELGRADHFETLACRLEARSRDNLCHDSKP
jgi:hypothetical protein